MEVVRLAIVGYGGMGRVIAREAAGMESVALTAAVEPDADRRLAAEEAHGLKGFESLDELLDADLADAAFVATPNKFHADCTVRCLKGGLHVFCEKPMAMNAAEGERMVAAAEEADRRLTINFSYRATGQARALKQAADEGLLGEVYFARTGWLRNRGIPRRGWFCDKEMAGGGPLIDLGVHRIDLALWLMGYPKPVSVTGVTHNMLGKRLAARWGQDYGVEDLAAGFVRFEGGAALSLEASWATNSEWREDMYTYVYGTKAGMAHRSIGGKYDFEARVWGEMGGAFAETVLQPVSGPSHLEAFVRSVREGTPVPVDPREALCVQRILDALYRSAETGGEVPL